jgi:endonuclease/exonuclease/phosphatase family metal-dependent hydrolase
VGVGRYHQVEVDRPYERLSGEHCAIFYDTTQVNLEQSSTFWLSETPDIPGSQSWGNDLARIVTWAIFKERSRAHRFVVFNTHYHWGEPFATRSTELLLYKIEAIAGALPVIILGDFNVPPTSSIHARFTRPDSLKPDFKPFRDVWESLGQSETVAGTFHNFTGQPEEPRIDWILVSPDFKLLSVQKITFQQAGRYPSDHFPVLAVFQLR